MDACRQPTVNSEIDLRNVTEHWMDFLRKPDEYMPASTPTDPFPYDPTEHPEEDYQPLDDGCIIKIPPIR